MTCRTPRTIRHRALHAVAVRSLGGTRLTRPIAERTARTLGTPHVPPTSIRPQDCNASARHEQHTRNRLHQQHNRLCRNTKHEQRAHDDRNRAPSMHMYRDGRMSLFLFQSTVLYDGKRRARMAREGRRVITDTPIERRRRRRTQTTSRASSIADPRCVAV